MKKVFLPFAICLLSIATAACKGGSGDKSNIFSSNQNSSASTNSSQSSSASAQAEEPVDFQIDTGTNDLEISVAAGFGTKVVNSKSLNTSVAFTHSSFDNYNNTVFEASPDGTSLVGEYSLYDDDFEDKIHVADLEDLTPVFLAATFRMTMTFNMPAGRNDYGLYLNTLPGASYFYGMNETLTSEKAYRMAFIPEVDSTGSVTKIFANLEDAYDCTYIGSIDNMMGEQYKYPELIFKGYSAPLPDMDVSRRDAIFRPDYLGMFETDLVGGMKTLSYYAVVWLEGTDPNLINSDSAKMVKVKSHLVFDVAELNQ